MLCIIPRPLPVFKRSEHGKCPWRFVFLKHHTASEWLMRCGIKCWCDDIYTLRMNTRGIQSGGCFLGSRSDWLIQ